MFLANLSGVLLSIFDLLCDVLDELLLLGTFLVLQAKRFVLEHKTVPRWFITIIGNEDKGEKKKRKKISVNEELSNPHFLNLLLVFTRIYADKNILDARLFSFNCFAEVSDQGSISADTRNQMTHGPPPKNVLGTSLHLVFHT